MKKRMIGLVTAAALLLKCSIFAHCQMPCGIYHDDMVFEFVDQYIETMYKALTVMQDSKFETVRERNEFTRWVYEKEMESDDVARMLTCYFMQQKIKPDEQDTPKRLASAHKLLFLLVQMKQNVDFKILSDFGKEWEKFKLMFHIEGYECALEKMKTKQREQRQKEEAKMESEKKKEPASAEKQINNNEATNKESEVQKTPGK
jgi:nickel superoxide dismutase